MSTNLSTTYQTTTSQILPKDLHTPFSGKPARSKIQGLIQKVDDSQQVAASGNQFHVVRSAGNLLRVLVGVATPAGVGESMTIDIQKNGTSILTGGTTLDIVHTTTPVGLFDVTSLCIAGTSFAVGDRIEIIRTYTAGGGPDTMTETDVSLEFAP